MSRVLIPGLYCLQAMPRCCRGRVVLLSGQDRVAVSGIKGDCKPVSCGEIKMSSNKVKAFRLARAWSQEQLAEMAALSVRTVQRIENGDQPSLETLSALAAVFGVSVTELSGQEEAGEEALDQRILAAREKLNAESRFWRSLLTGVVVCVLLFFLNRSTTPASSWSLWVTAIWGGLLVVRGLRLFVFADLIAQWHKRRLQRLLRK